MTNRLTDKLSVIEIPIYLFLILVFPFMWMSFGLNFTDGPYHFQLYNGNLPARQFSFLYGHLGAGWILLAGDSMISFRILAALLNILIVVIPGLVFFGQSIPLREKLRYIAIALTLITGFTNYTLGYDNFSKLVLASSVLVAFYYLQTSQRYLILILIMGILTAIGTAIRLPTLLMAFPLMFLIVAVNKINRGKIKRMITHLGLFLAAMLFSYAILWWVAGSDGVNPSAKNIAAQKHSPVVKENTITISESNELGGFLGKKKDSELTRHAMSYKLKNIVDKYIQNGFRIFEIMGVLVLLGVAWLHRMILKKWRYVFIFLLAILFIIYSYQTFLFVSYNRELSFLISSMALLLIMVLFYQALTRRDNTLVMFTVLLFLTGFVSVGGSNTGLLKLSGTYLFILPLVLFFLNQKLKRDHMKGIMLIIGLITLLVVSNKLYFGNTYEDGRIKDLTASITHDKLKGIRTTPARKQQVEEILNLVSMIEDKEDQAKYIFYGTRGWLYNYLLDLKQPYPHTFWMTFDNQKEAEIFSRYLTNEEIKPYVFLVMDYPDKPVQSDPALIGEQLALYSYKMIAEGSQYQLYLHNPTDKLVE